MLFLSIFNFILSASIASFPFSTASPTPSHSHRAVTELNQEAFEEAHSRDNGATRAFSNVQIKTSDNQCLFIDPLSGDFRANLTPIQVAACDGTNGQSWDIITAGLHNNVPGKILIVNTLTQACLDLNQGRVGREVTGFSCGGRAAGEGVVTPDQLFELPADANSFTLTTARGNGKCLAVAGSALSISSCNASAAAQKFSLSTSGGNRNDTPTTNTSFVSSVLGPTSTAAASSTTVVPLLSSTANVECSATIITTLANPSTVTVTETVTTESLGVFATPTSTTY